MRYSILKNQVFFLIPFLLVLFSCSESDKIENGFKTIHFPGTDIIKQTVEYKKGKKNGFLKEFYRNGQLKAKQFYVNDSLNDSSMFYHKNGKIQSLHIYKNKVKSGAWREYNDKGQIISEMFFRNGLIDSTCSNYSYRSHHLITRVTYKQGYKNGTEETYYPNGQLKSKVYYNAGFVRKGTEEWLKNGAKINNDFTIHILENDAVLLKNTLTYMIKLENPKESDKVYQVLNPEPENDVTSIVPIQKVGSAFVYKYEIPKGSFVMEKVTIAAFRKTDFGNTVIKTQSFNVSSNHF